VLSLENFVEWYRVTCDVWGATKDQINEERKPPANFDVVWDDVILSAKLAFDGFDEGDSGLITPEAMLEVAAPIWLSKPSDTPISKAEQVKLSEELLNYRQRRNNGLMSFEDFAAWHTRIPQALAGIRSLRQKQRVARDPASAAASLKAKPAQPAADPLADIMSSIGNTLGVVRAAPVPPPQPAGIYAQVSSCTSLPLPSLDRRVTHASECLTVFRSNKSIDSFLVQIRMRACSRWPRPANFPDRRSKACLPAHKEPQPRLNGHQRRLQNPKEWNAGTHKGISFETQLFLVMSFSGKVLMLLLWTSNHLRLPRPLSNRQW
jgi:hypothetical protein